MKMRTALAAMALLTFVLAGPAVAQQKEIPGELKTVKGTVEAIDHNNRVLTLKMEDDEYDNINIPKGVKRFDEIKVGDTLQLRYHDNVTVRIKDPGEPAINSAELAAIPADAPKPAGTVAAQRKMTVTVTEIDHEKGVATVEGPNGYKYSRRIQDPEAAKKVKVGDRLDITWTEAVHIAVNP